MTAPLSANASPASFDAGPLGKVYVTGVASGLAFAQSNHSPFDRDATADLSNGQVFIQTTSGPVQFFIEAGAYSLPSLGAPYAKASPTTNNTYSALPVAYVKLQPTAEISVQIGKLPTLIGSEYTFTFQNMNIERGLLWNQEPAVSDGVQLNYVKGPVTASVSLNDGFYSNRYSWISGLFTYAFGSNDSLTFAGGGNLAKSHKSTTATPLLQNNGSIYNVMYSHTSGPWTVGPYFQYTTNRKITAGGATYTSSDTVSGAVLAKYSFTPEFSIAGRAEYIAASADACPAAALNCVQSNVLYGPKSKALSLTLTPTYQKGIFFIRGEGSLVSLSKVAPGAGFGTTGTDKTQVRALIETGFLF